MSEYLIRKMKSEDIPEIIELLNLVFDPWPNLFDLRKTRLDHWEWKHIDNHNGPSFIIVGEKKDQIVSCSHTIFRKAIINSKEYSEVCGQDLAVHPDHRGKRLSSMMSDFKYQAPEIMKYDFSSSISNVDRVISRSKKQNRIKLPKTINYYIRILDSDLHFKKNKDISFLKKAGFKILDTLNRKRFSIPDIDDAIIKTVNNFDDRFDVFWSSIKEEFSFLFERSSKYLNWRYCDIRGGEYVTRILEDSSGMLLGYIVCRINRIDENYPQGFVVELVVKGGDIAYMSLLLYSALRYFDDNDVNVSYLWCQPGSDMSSLASKMGYLNTQFEPMIYFRPIVFNDLKNSITTGKMNFLIQLGDTDWI